MCIDRTCRICTKTTRARDDDAVKGRQPARQLACVYCRSVCRFMHGGDKDQGPRSPDRFASTIAGVLWCGEERTRPAVSAAQCIALHRGSM